MVPFRNISSFSILSHFLKCQIYSSAFRAKWEKKKYIYYGVMTVFYRVWLIGKEFQNSKDTQKFKGLQTSSSVSLWDSLGQNLLPHTQLEQCWVPIAVCFIPPWKSSWDAIDLCCATELRLWSICSLGLSGASFESQFNCCWLQWENSDPRNSHFFLYFPLLTAGWEKQP